MNSRPTPEALLDHWFGAARRDPARIKDQSAFWFKADPARDEALRIRFGAWVAKADRGELGGWQRSPASRLALILLLDQLPRNLFRGTPEAFSRDAWACALCLAGIATGMDRELALAERAFFYMPLQHAEDPAAQRYGVECFQTLVTDFPGHAAAARGFLNFSREHAEIIQRFGRFPHRNAILARASTPEEKSYLNDGATDYGQRTP